MPGVRVRHLRDGTKPLKVKIQDATLNLVYKPLAMSVADQDHYEEMLSDAKYNDALFAFLPKVLHSWDLIGDNEDVYDETPVPIDEDSMRAEVPAEVLRRILMAIMEDLYPNEKKKSSFGAA